MELSKEDKEFIDKVVDEGYAETDTDNTLFDLPETFGEVQPIRKEVTKHMPKFIDNYAGYDIPSGSGNFLKLEDGENRLRICTKALEVEYHEDKSGGKYSTTICPGHDVCELCKAGKSTKFKYAFLVLNRKDGKPYIYESPITVFRQVVAYDTNDEYGDVRKYDITIKKEGVGRNTAYTVIASPKKSDLSESEEKMIAESGVSLEAAYSLNGEK